MEYGALSFIPLLASEKNTAQQLPLIVNQDVRVERGLTEDIPLGIIIKRKNSVLI